MQAEISSEVEAPPERTDTSGLTKIEVLMKRQVIHQHLYCYLIGCSVRCSEKQMLKSPIKLLTQHSRTFQVTKQFFEHIYNSLVFNNFVYILKIYKSIRNRHLSICKPPPFILFVADLRIICIIIHLIHKFFTLIYQKCTIDIFYFISYT